MPKSKIYEVTDIEALKAFNAKTVVRYDPVFDNALILRLLRDFETVPGVKRLAQAEAAPETQTQTETESQD